VPAYSGSRNQAISDAVTVHMAALPRFTHTAALKRRPLCSYSQPALLVHGVLDRRHGVTRKTRL